MNKEHKIALEDFYKHLQVMYQRAKEASANPNGYLYMSPDLQSQLLKQVAAIKYFMLLGNRMQELEKELKVLKKGENDWWQKRWQNNDMGKKLFEIRKKWLTAYECAENWMKMYEDLRKEKGYASQKKMGLEANFQKEG